MNILNPKVSILMPVYNSENYVREAIESILNQTFFDFEFLIFNDGSVDKSSEIIKKFNDKRIKFFDYQENLGYLVRLNEGLKLAKGSYIARMDSDDISLPRRLERQVAFMDQHPDIAAAGTWARGIGALKGTIFPTESDPELLHCKLLFSNQINHPTVIMRASVLHKNNLFYSPDYYHTEDYKMWLDISRVGKLANIPEILLDYRIHSSQISQYFASDHWKHSLQLINFQLSELGIIPTPEELLLHGKINLGKSEFNLQMIENWLMRLADANFKKKIYPQTTFLKVLAEKWTNICFRRFLIKHWVLGIMKNQWCTKKEKDVFYQYYILRSIWKFMQNCDLVQLCYSKHIIKENADAGSYISWG